MTLAAGRTVRTSLDATLPEGSTRRDGLTALVLAAGLAALYLANLDFLPGNDATPNVYLAAQLLEGEGLSFTPSTAPYLFSWSIRTSRGLETRRIHHLDQRLDGATARELYGAGYLVPSAPYCLVESVRFAPATGEREYVSLYGAGAALAGLPVLAPIRAMAGDLREHPAALWYGAKLAAALLAAASAGVLFLLARRHVGYRAALLLALTYGVGTPVWSVSSQALWQHPSNELFLCLGALALASARGSSGASALAGAAFAAATACRPTSALFAVAAGAWLLLSDRRAFWAFVAGSAPLALALGAYNAWYLGSPFSFGQAGATAVALAKTGSPELWRPNVGAALAGLFLSPARGVFVFSPVLLLAIPGAILAVRRPEHASLRPLLAGTLLVLAVDAAWFDWWGGWSYGWRRLVDLAPFLVLLLAPVVPIVRRSAGARAVCGVALAWGVLLQVTGAFAYDLRGWNARRAWRVTLPAGDVVLVHEEAQARAGASRGARVESVTLDVDLPENRERLWSWTDGPVPYYLVHFAEARRQRQAAVDRWVAGWGR
jgi:hypothetical protein